MEFLSHQIRAPQDVEYDDFVRRVREFTVSDMLRFCNQVASWLDTKALPDLLLPVAPSIKYQCPLPAKVYLADWMVAFIAKTSLLYSGENMHGWLKPENFLGLAYMYANMKDPFTRGIREVPGPAGAMGMLIRTSWEQFGYQARMHKDLPRAWLLLIDGGRTIELPSMDVEEEFEGITGLDLERFMTIGFSYYAGLFSFSGPFAHQSVKRYFPSTGVMSGKITEEDCDRFLAKAAASPAEFRAISEPRIENTLYAKTEFNALLGRPLITHKDEVLCPVPKLVIHRITSGVVFDLMDNFREAGKVNAFRAFFGRLFEHYVGRLLKWSYEDKNIHSESTYGEPERAGPDWVVIDGDTAILIECRTSSLRLQTRVFGEMASVTHDINRMIFETVRRFPRKVEELRSGITGIDTSQVKRYECVVLLYDRVFFEFIYRNSVRELFHQKGEEPFDDYCLMDIDQFESLSAYHRSAQAMGEVLPLRPQPPTQLRDRDFRAFLHEFQEHLGLSDEHPLLAQVLDEFFVSAFGKEALEPGLEEQDLFDT